MRKNAKRIVVGLVVAAWLGGSAWALTSIDSDAEQQPAVGRVFEDGSGRFVSGTVTLSDGTVIELSDRAFCLAGYACED